MEIEAPLAAKKAKPRDSLSSCVSMRTAKNSVHHRSYKGWRCAFTGSASVISAMGAGKTAAQVIDEYLSEKNDTDPMEEP